MIICKFIVFILFKLEYNKLMSLKILFWLLWKILFKNLKLQLKKLNGYALIKNDQSINFNF